MDRDSAVALLKLRLGNNALASLDALIVTEMQFVQRTILEQGPFKPWFLETNGLVTSVASTRAASLPSDFIKEVDEQAFWRYGTYPDELSLVEMEKGDADNLSYLYGEESKAPTTYTLYGEGSVELYPLPDDAYTFKLYYYAHDTVLSSNIENNWLKHAPDLLIAETGIIIAEQYIQSPEMGATFEKAKQRAERRLVSHDTARKEANHDRVRGGA